MNGPSIGRILDGLEVAMTAQGRNPYGDPGAGDAQRDDLVRARDQRAAETVSRAAVAAGSGGDDRGPLAWIRARFARLTGRR